MANENVSDSDPITTSLARLNGVSPQPTTHPDDYHNFTRGISRMSRGKLSNSTSKRKAGSFTFSDDPSDSHDQDSSGDDSWVTMQHFHRTDEHSISTAFPAEATEPTSHTSKVPVDLHASFPEPASTTDTMPNNVLSIHTTEQNRKSALTSEEDVSRHTRTPHITSERSTDPAAHTGDQNEQTSRQDRPADTSRARTRMPGFVGLTSASAARGITRAAPPTRKGRASLLRSHVSSTTLRFFGPGERRLSSSAGTTRRTSLDIPLLQADDADAGPGPARKPKASLPFIRISPSSLIPTQPRFGGNIRGLFASHKKDAPSSIPGPSRKSTSSETHGTPSPHIMPATSSTASRIPTSNSTTPTREASPSTPMDDAPHPEIIRPAITVPAPTGHLTGPGPPVPPPIEVQLELLRAMTALQDTASQMPAGRRARRLRALAAALMETVARSRDAERAADAAIEACCRAVENNEATQRGVVEVRDLLRTVAKRGLGEVLERFVRR